MEPNEVEEVISHWGVKGMHWGIRKRRSVNKATRSASKAIDPEFLATQQALRTKTAHLSNDQIKKANARIKLETEFRKNNPTKLERGHAHAVKILAVAGTGVAAYEMVNSKTGKEIIGKGSAWLVKKGLKV